MNPSKIYQKLFRVLFSRDQSCCKSLSSPLSPSHPSHALRSVSRAQRTRREWYEMESCMFIIWRKHDDMHGKRPAAMFLTWQLKQVNEKQMGDCETEQFDLFITIILNTSFYLGVTILIVMVTIGLYFFIFHCFWKPYSKR